MEFETASVALAFTYAVQGAALGGLIGGMRAELRADSRQNKYFVDRQLTPKAKKVLGKSFKGAMAGAAMGAVFGFTAGLCIDEMHKSRRELDNTSRQECVDNAEPSTVVVYTPPSVFTKPVCTYE